MDDWSLPDNNDSSLNSGLVDNVFFWKFQTLDSLGLSPNESNVNTPIQKRNQSNSTVETNNQIPSVDFQDEVDKLFQESLAQQEREQQQKQQEQQHKHHSFQHTHQAYPHSIHQNQTPFNHMHTQSNIQPILSPQVNNNNTLHNAALISPEVNIGQTLNSPTSTARKRTRSSNSFDHPNKSPSLTKSFIDHDSISKSALIDPAAIYNIPYSSSLPLSFEPQSPFDVSSSFMDQDVKQKEVISEPSHSNQTTQSLFTSKQSTSPPLEHPHPHSQPDHIHSNNNNNNNNMSTNKNSQALSSAPIPISSPTHVSIPTSNSSISSIPLLSRKPIQLQNTTATTTTTAIAFHQPMLTSPSSSNPQNATTPSFITHQTSSSPSPSIPNLQIKIQNPVTSQPITTVGTTPTLTTFVSSPKISRQSSSTNVTHQQKPPPSILPQKSNQTSPIQPPQPPPPPPLPSSNLYTSPVSSLNISHPTPIIQPRPQLRLHITKRRPQSPKPCVKDDRDPMKPELDMVHLRRLTVMILRTLGVSMTVDEIPTVDIEQSLPTDSEQVLPASAMQLITAMILGTSGDKEVSQTVGSQICNGDLVALQRMIVAGLKSRNIVIHTIQSSSSSSTSISNSHGKNNNNTDVKHDPDTKMKDNDINDNNNQQLIYDLSTVTYHTPTNVTRLFLRLYRFILNILLSTPDCWPFIQPVPESAKIYHREIKHPMDLSTIERNVWNGLYTRFAKFEQDMQLIWINAKTFHRNAGTIPKHADNLETLFYKVIMDLKKQIRKNLPGITCDYKFDTSDSLPEESDFAYPPMKQVFSKQTVVFGIAAISPTEPKAKKQKGLTNDKQLYLQLNGPFFHSVERMKQNPNGNFPPVPRFYIAKNRTLLRQVRAQGVLAIFYNTKTTRIKSKYYQIETDMVLAYPASPLFDIEQTDDFAPKGWIYLRPLRVVEKLIFSVNESIERDHFRRMFATSKFVVIDDVKSLSHNNNNNNNKSETKRMLKKMVQQILNLPDDNVDVGAQPQHPPLIKYKQTTLDTSLISSMYKKETGQVSPSLMNIDDDKDQQQQQQQRDHHQHSATNIKEGTFDHYYANTSLSTPEDQQRSVQSPDSVSSIVSTHNQVAKLETIIPTAPLSSSSSSSSSHQSEMSHKVWQKLLNVCTSKGAQVTNVQEKYGHINWSSPDSEGYFKQVYFLDEVVVQTFRQMTMYQRITEVACLMKLRNLPHMAQLREVLYNNNGDITGLSMERYQTTLKQYTHTHSHHRLSAYQKFDIIYQMLGCMKTIHNAGLAHRDLSEVNIMVNTIDGELEDGTSKICLYLIDFGKAVFCEPEDLRAWFVDVPRGNGEYDGDIVPENEEELNTWCESLPWIKGKPDHGYRMYRSIQTLPKTRSDTQVLPWLIHPQSEDIYSIGVIVWKIFTETEPWRGILDTDLQGLRYVAEDDYRIQRALEHEVHGELSRQLLLKCLRTRPQDRNTAEEILDWLSKDDVRTGLLNEWKMYSSETRATRKVKSMYGFDDTDSTASTTTSTTTTATTDEKRNKRGKRSTGGNGGNMNSKSRGRPKKVESTDV